MGNQYRRRARRDGAGRACETRRVALVSIDRIVAARERVAPVVRRTPVEGSDSLSRLAGRPVLVKPEHLQRTGSFKIRGAYAFMAGVPEGREVVAGSAGNHAQGVALAATLTGRPSRVFMPERAALPKLQATSAYGAVVETVPGGVDLCLERAREYAARTGAVLVPPFDDDAVIAGQATVGVEISEEAPDAEVVVVPIGGGGLIAGVAAALRALRPDVRVVGVQPEGAASMRRSLDAGHRVRVDPVTMADGVALATPGERTLEHVRVLVDDVVTVSEEQVSRAVLLLLERAKALVEPSGALPVAAILAGRVAGDGPAVAVLSGGNVDPLLLTRLIDHGLQAAGRFMAMRIVIEDRPGGLHLLTGTLAASGLNVIDVEHHREGLSLPLAQVEVLVTVETRDREHQEAVLAALRGEGYRVTVVR
jgi:threonine dehydratase